MSRHHTNMFAFTLVISILGAGVSVAHAQAPRQAGSVDSSTYNTSGAAQSNETRPTLDRSTTTSTAAARTDAEAANAPKDSGWSQKTTPIIPSARNGSSSGN